MGNSKLIKKETSKKMKTIICLIVMLAISNYAQSAVCTAAAASFCQSCSGAACGSCYSWGVGTNKDKIWGNSTATTCTGALPSVWKVTNCKFNNLSGDPATLNASTSSISNSQHPRCTECDGQKFLTWNTNATTETCTDTAH